MRTRIVETAAALELLANVPAVAKRMDLIQDMQLADTWRDVTPEMVDEIRLALRDLVQLIEPGRRRIIVTDFTDHIGPGVAIPAPAVADGVDQGRFRMKVRRFLDRHADHIAILKLRRVEQLTSQDLAELERMMREEGTLSPEGRGAWPFECGLGAFLRSLVGLDRKAAKDAFNEVMAGQPMSATQIEFLDLIIDHLVEAGQIDVSRFYESPFTDIDEGGLTAVFPSEVGMRIVEIIQRIDATAAA